MALFPYVTGTNTDQKFIWAKAHGTYAGWIQQLTAMDPVSQVRLVDALQTASPVEVEAILLASSSMHFLTKTTLVSY